jgi:multiple sugar transport system substrate-binding protein
MRGRRWVVALAVMALVAAACSNNGTSNNANGSSGGPVTLTFWLYEEGYHFLVDQVVPAFEAKYPNIHIEVTPYPEAQYMTKVDTALAAGAQPDLGLMASRLWMKEGLLEPLDDYIKQQGIDLSTFSPSIVGSPGSLNADEACAYEGKLYCLGSYTGSVQLFYNKDMFDAAGIAYPAPWPPMSVDDFVNLACQLTDKSNQVWGAAYGDPVTWMPWEMVVSPDGRTAQGYVNGPTSVHVHDILAKGIRDGCAPSSNILDPWEQGTDFFAQGKLAMVVTDFQSLFKIEDAGINYGVTAPATPEGIEPFFNVWTDSVGIFKGTDHLNEAEQFIAFLATDAQRLRVEKAGDMPLDTKVATEMNWADDNAGRQEALQILPHARPAVFIPNRWDTYGPIFDAFGLIVGQEKTAQEALDDAAPAIQENLDKAWKIWEGP